VVGSADTLEKAMALAEQHYNDNKVEVLRDGALILKL
jgi:hypothetical protein